MTNFCNDLISLDIRNFSDGALWKQEIESILDENEEQYRYLRSLIQKRIPKLDWAQLSTPYTIRLVLNANACSCTEDFLKHVSDYYSGLCNDRKAEPTDATTELIRPTIVVTFDEISDEVTHNSGDHRSRFLDSNIWFHHVSWRESVKNMHQDLFRAIASCIIYLQQELYHSNVAIEYLEFQSRMLKNSWLPLVGSGGGHAHDVHPFLFHSESYMAHRLRKQNNKDDLKIENYQWSFLWIDDHSYCKTGDKCAFESVPLGYISGKRENSVTKLSLIKKRIADVLSVAAESITAYVPVANESDDRVIIDGEEPPAATGKDLPCTIYCVATVNEALEVMKSRSFDIILLDYLLGEDNSVAGGGRSFGSDLLTKLNPEDGDEKVRDAFTRGPLNRHWIFPTTAFSQAMLDEIRAAGHSHFSPVWHLSTGADPVNTPHLFAYKLRKFLEMQINEVDFDLCDILKIPFSRVKDSDLKNVRTAAKDCYPEITRYLGNFHQLHKDKNKGSLFAKSMIEKFKADITANLLEHAHYLMYLIAYAPALHWGKMWDEFNTVDKHGLMTDCSTCRHACLKNIRNYIISISKGI
jgi:hypothetical protein